MAGDSTRAETFSNGGLSQGDNLWPWRQVHRIAFSGGGASKVELCSFQERKLSEANSQCKICTLQFEIRFLRGRVGYCLLPTATGVVWGEASPSLRPACPGATVGYLRREL